MILTVLWLQTYPDVAVKTVVFPGDKFGEKARYFLEEVRLPSTYLLCGSALHALCWFVTYNAGIIVSWDDFSSSSQMYQRAMQAAGDQLTQLATISAFLRCVAFAFLRSKLSPSASPAQTLSNCWAGGWPRRREATSTASTWCLSAWTPGEACDHQSAPMACLAAFRLC